MFHHLAQLLSQFCQFPFSPGRTGRGWNSQNPSQSNPAIRADAPPCRDCLSTETKTFLTQHLNNCCTNCHLKGKKSHVIWSTFYWILPRQRNRFNTATSRQSRRLASPSNPIRRATLERRSRWSYRKRGASTPSRRSTPSRYQDWRWTASAGRLIPF